MRKNPDESGFTLVELIMAIVIGALFFASVANLIASNSRLDQRSRDLATANSFAENKIEELRSAGYLSLNDGTTDITAELPDELQKPRNASLTISDQEDTESIKRIELTITYSDQGNSKSYSYSSYLGELGVGQY